MHNIITHDFRNRLPSRPSHKFYVLYKLQDHLYSEMSPTAKRALFQTPRSSKRQKTPRAKITLAQLPSSIKPEIKFSDRFNSSAVTNSVASFVRPGSTPGAQGLDGDQFVGSECYLRSLDYTLNLPPTGWQICRVSILMLRDPSVTPVSLDPSFRYDHHQFVVLYDEVFSSNERNHTRIKKVLNMKQKWNVLGTTLQDGNVVVVANINTPVDVSACVRTYYTDP